MMLDGALGGAISRSFRTAMVVVVLGLSAFGPGCRKSDSAADLKERAQTYWGLKQSKGWEEVYDRYLDPNAKEKVTKAAFLKRRLLAFDILTYEISNVQETGDTATVEVTNTNNFPLKAPDGELKFIKKQVTTKDSWVRRDGVWYVVLTE